MINISSNDWIWYLQKSLHNVDIHGIVISTFYVLRSIPRANSEMAEKEFWFDGMRNIDGTRFVHNYDVFNQFTTQETCGLHTFDSHVYLNNAFLYEWCSISACNHGRIVSLTLYKSTLHPEEY